MEVTKVEDALLQKMLAEGIEANHVKALAEAHDKLVSNELDAKKHEDDVEEAKLKLDNESQKIEYDYKLRKDQIEVDKEKVKVEREKLEADVKLKTDALEVDKNKVKISEESNKIDREKIDFEKYKMEVEKALRERQLDNEAQKIFDDKTMRQRQLDFEREKLDAEREAQQLKARNELIVLGVGVAEKLGITGISIMMLSKLIVGVIKMEADGTFPSNILSKEVFSGVGKSCIGWFAKNIFK